MKENLSNTQENELVAQAYDQYQNEINHSFKRKDLTSLITYTIDDIYSEEIDDAISIEIRGRECWIWVHVADVATVVKPGGILDKRAREKATSIYLSTRTIPLFQKAISNDLFSFRQGHTSLAMSIGILLDHDGLVIDYKLHKSIIKPRYSLTYEEADELIDLAPPEEEYLSMIHEILKTRQNWRIDQGAIILEQDQGKFIINNQNVEIRILETSSARSLISEAMILVGTIIANIGVNKNLAFPFRGQHSYPIHDKDLSNKYQHVAVRNTFIKTNITKSIVSAKPLKHFGLGLNSYVQATSPIRRYLDLLVQRQTYNFIDKLPLLSKEEIASEIDNAKPLLNEARAIWYEDQKVLQDDWFSKRQYSHQGLFLKWLNSTKKIALVYITQIAIEISAEVKNKINLLPGQTVSIRTQRNNDNPSKLKYFID